MTENNSEFSQESSAGGCVVDVPNELNESAVPSEEDAKVKDHTNVELENTENAPEPPDCVPEPTIADNLEDKKSETNSEVISSESEQVPSLQDHWLKLNAFFKKVYHTILDGEKPPDEYGCHVDIIKELVIHDPHQLFARLEMDLQEFIIEIKLRQMELLNCVHTEEGPNLFIFCLIESYNKLMFAANTLSPLLLPLEVEHLSHFNISWRGLNQHLFHKLVFTEPKVQKILPFCISKLGKINSEMADFNKRLIHQFLTFDDEMTKIGGKWREAESAIIKYHQEHKVQAATERMMKVNWELMQNQTKLFHEELKHSGETFDLDELPEVDTCECCHSSTECLENSVPLTALESLFEFKGTKNSHSTCDSSCKEAEILSHLSAEGKKLYSHLHKFKTQQRSLNGGKNQCPSSGCVPGKESKENSEQVSPPKITQQNTPSLSPSAELHKTLIRKQVIHQQRQQHQKKLMQMMQSSQQKEIQHKIQKQLQEHQLLLQQQRKIDELHAHLLQQHPMHLDKDIQKKVHLQMQQRLMQKHKQMEEKFHQQVQQHMQQHQDKPSPVFTKSNSDGKSSQGSSSSSTASSKSQGSGKSSAKCSGSACGEAPSGPTGNVSNNTSADNNPVASSKAINSNNISHKNSTTQTTTSSPGQSRNRHHPLPDVVKSASYVCPKHCETGKNMPHNHADHNSEDNSSDDDDSSERSNSPQRHCDCCYCEVFGSAPVSRNFQETRERLRLILTKKKAKSNSVAPNSEKQPTEQISSANVHTAQAQPASQGIKPKKEGTSVEKKVPRDTEYKGDKSIDEILDFIEGNKSNTKRIAKKLRKRQRQLEEEERRRKEEEAERLRLEELRRKEEEEKRRLEEERRKQELRKEQNRKKGKKKNEKFERQMNALLESNKKAKNKNKNQVQMTNDKTQKSAQNQKNSQEKKVVNQQQVKQNSQAQKKQKQDQQQLAKQQQSKQKVQDKQKSQPNNKNTNVAQKKTQNQQKNDGKVENSGQPQMVTIKRVIQPNTNEPTVTITLRGNTPKEDKVLYTLTNGQMCQIKDEKGKKKAAPANNNVSKKNVKPSAPPTVPNNYGNYSISSANAPVPPRSVPFGKNCSIIGNGVNHIADRLEHLKLGAHSVPNEPAQRYIPAPTATQAELTTPTAIQINQAVNQLSSRPTFPNSFDLENIKLPPGITITKVDPSTIRKPIQQMKQQQQAPQPIPQTQIRQNMIPSVASSSNVIVVDTGEQNFYHKDEPMFNGSKKKRRRRKKDTQGGQNDMVNMASSYNTPIGMPPRMGPMNPNLYGGSYMNNDYRNVPQQPAAIIQMNGSLVTIRNPALHQALTGQQMEYQSDIRNSNFDETMFSPAPEEMESEDVDEYERELEAFKRFCSQSVPAESKAKVNLNLDDIVLKKKGSAIGCS